MHRKLTISSITLKMNTDSMLERAYKAELLTELEIKLICSKVKEILAKEKNVKNLTSPITVVGDVHGYY